MSCISGGLIKPTYLNFKMKAQLAFVFLVVLSSAVSLSHLRERDTGRPDVDYPELSNHWVLKFDHASRAGVRQDSNSFGVYFNGQKLQEYLPTDYEIHSEKIRVQSVVGKNSFNFIGSGISDGLGQGVDNIQLLRDSFCGLENAAINGGFEEGHNLGHGWAIFANGKIPGWVTADNQLQIGWGKIYNSRWPDSHISELDGNHNTNAYQIFHLDEWFRISDYE